MVKIQTYRLTDWGDVDPRQSFLWKGDHVRHREYTPPVVSVDCVESPQLSRNHSPQAHSLTQRPLDCLGEELPFMEKRARQAPRPVAVNDSHT